MALEFPGRTGRPKMYAPSAPPPAAARNYDANMCLGCGLKWAQNVSGLCRGCRDLGLPGRPPEDRLPLHDRYPIGAFCVVHLPPAPLTIRTWQPGVGYVELERVWNGS